MSLFIASWWVVNALIVITCSISFIQVLLAFTLLSYPWWGGTILPCLLLCPSFGGAKPYFILLWISIVIVLLPGFVPVFICVGLATP